MPAKQDATILVVARPYTDLEHLTRYGSPLLAPVHGLVGKSIATKVREGNGRALITDGELMAAIDTSEGVNAILDNFDLFDARSKSPLLFRLLRDRS